MSNVSISDDVSTQLTESWQIARQFEAQVCHLQAPVGTGSKHLLNHFQRSVAEECITWHIRFRENLYGWEVLPVLANGLWKTIRHSTQMVNMVRGCLELDLGDERMNRILKGMSESLLECHESEGTQLRLPSENPVLGLVLLARALMKEVPMLIIVENLQFCGGYLPLVFLLAALRDAQQTRTMVVLHSTPINDETISSIPRSVQALLQTIQGRSLGVESWSDSQIGEFLHVRGLKDISIVDMMAWTGGRQECVAEMVAWLAEDPTGPKAFQSRQLVFAPTDKPELTEQVMRIAATIGWRFPISTVAMLLNIEATDVKEVLLTQSHLIELENDLASFKYVLHQLRLQRDTLNQLPEVSGMIAENLYATVGRARPEYLYSAARLFQQLGREAEADEALQLLLDLDDDVIWLAMLEVLIRFDITLTTNMMEPLWVRASRHHFRNNPEVARDFEQRALNWAAEQNSPTVALSVYRESARFENRQGQISDAEHKFQRALHIAQQEDWTFLQVDIRIDMIEFYVAGNEIRRASEQLILLDGAPLSEVQRIRLLGVHARIAQSEGEYSKAVGLFLEGRKIAGSVYKWGLATDLTLLAAETLLMAEQFDDAKNVLLQIQTEADTHDRTEPWQQLFQQLPSD